jgi:HEAT repeat protein
VNISHISTDARKEVGTPVVPPLLQALKDKDKFVHWPATKALGKIGDQVKSMPILKDIMAGLHLAREWKQLEIVANRLEALQGDQHPLPDPLVLSSARSWWRILA